MGPIAVDQPKFYDLGALGHPAPIVLTQQRRQSGPVSFRIPAEAHRRYPYVRVLLRCRVRISRDTGSGFGYVDMKTGHGSSASTEFATQRTANRLRIHWDTVDVNGETDHFTRRASISVDYPNYMLFDDTRPGSHKLRFKLESYGGFRFDRVTISPKSGIALTSESPYAPAVTVSMTAVTGGFPKLNRAMTIAVRIRNPGHRPVRGVAVDLTPDRGLRLIGAEAHRRWPRIGPGEVVERRVRVVALTRGKHVLHVSAGPGRRTSSGDLVFTTAGAVGGRSGGGSSIWLWVVLGGVVVGAGVWRLRAAAAVT